MTSNGRWPQKEDDLKILNVEYLSNHWSDLPQISKLSLGDQTKVKKCFKWRQTPMEDDFQWKTLSIGRWPQIIKSGISQQPLIRSSSNFKLKLREPNKKMLQMKTTSIRRQPQMEDDLKILNMEYLSNHWSDLLQIFNLSSEDQPKIKRLKMKTTSDKRQPQILKVEYPLVWSSSNFKLKLRWTNQNKKCFKRRRPPMEDGLKISKAEFLSKHWSDLPQILNLNLQIRTTSNGRQPQNIFKKWSISASTARIFLKV
jgi:hypothetical protein